MYKLLKNIKTKVFQKNNDHLILTTLSFCKLFIKLKIKEVFGKKYIAISLIEHIGDIIANEPIAREVRKRHPNSTVIWFVRKPYKDLIKYNAAIDKAYIVYCLTTWIWLREKFSFEAIYDLHFNGRGCKICNRPLEKENVDNTITGTNYFNYGSLLKASCLHNKLTIDDDYPRLYIPSNYATSLKKKVQLTHYFVIHCTSNESIKDWENKKWQILVEQIIMKFQLSVIEIGNNSCLQYNNPKYYNYCGKLELLETAYLIQKAVLFIGIDSGPAHMANALGILGVILLGEYYFGMKNYNPFSGYYGSGEKCRLVYSYNSVKEIPVEEVLENLDSLLKETTK